VWVQPSNIKQYQAISGNIKQYQAISSNIKQYQAISSNIKQYQAIRYDHAFCYPVLHTQHP